MADILKGDIEYREREKIHFENDEGKHRKMKIITFNFPF